MKIIQQLKPARLAVAGLAALVSASASAAMPSGEYACQVRAAGGHPGYVLVQANDREQAEIMAQRNRATTFDGVSVQPVELVECILQPEERFRDQAFRERFELLEF
ncbi:MAG: hypothetical protein H6985_12890 [Pseudomonadales bacterium]|nr:hypothetical protein [Halioglobus sp.]MCP5130468.1 hypothetical protein [Pseudomonadales bacterium]